MKATPHRTIPFAALSVLLLGLVLVLATRASEPADAAESYPGQGFLPDNRAWEMVSPPDKNGGSIAQSTSSTQVAADCSSDCSVTFASTTAFGDSRGFAGPITQYMARRLGETGTQGWVTHGITEPIGTLTTVDAGSSTKYGYVDDLSSDLSRGAYYAKNPLTTPDGPHPNVENVENLYLRTDLLNPGIGTYDLLTDAPVPLPKTNGQGPWYAAANPDVSTVAFEARDHQLADAPAGAQFKLYVAAHGETHFVNQVPAASDAICGGIHPACTSETSSTLSGPHDSGTFASSAGQRRQNNVQRLISADGSRVFFRAPVNNFANSNGTVMTAASRLYMRNDQGTADQSDDTFTRIQQSEKTTPEAPQPARFWYATEDGTQAFFSTPEGLVDGDDNGSEDLYRYTDSNDPANDANLTRISIDAEGPDAPNVTDVIQVSPDGEYVYFIAQGELVPGQDPVTGGLSTGGSPVDRTHALGFYLWHDGEIRSLGQFEDHRDVNSLQPAAQLVIDSGSGAFIAANGVLLFAASDSTGFEGVGDFEGYDHGECDRGGSLVPCRKLFVYVPGEDKLKCVSCNPSGATGTHNEWPRTEQETGGTRLSDRHRPNALTSDGEHVFFTTGESLVPEDDNGPCDASISTTFDELPAPCHDAYEYDIESGRHRLLSSGNSTSGSYFVGASDDGSDVFIATREKLSAWDTDGAYDIYDARIDGGFPEPSTETCGSADECRGPGSSGPGAENTSSSGFEGEGNVEAAAPPDCSSSERKVSKAKKKLKKARKRVRKADGKKAKKKAKRTKKRAKKRVKQSKRKFARCEGGNS